jgi:hypothetical protein
MGLLAWWKRTTFEGSIKKELGIFTGTRSGKIIKFQELEKKSVSEPRRFRLNLITRTAFTYHSSALAMEEAEVRKLADALSRALSSRD